MRKENIIKVCEEDFIPSVRDNLEKENAWLKSEIKDDAESILDDLNSTYLLDHWSSTCLQRATYYKLSYAVYEKPELRKKTQKLCDDLMEFRKKLIIKQKEIKERIVFLINEGIHNSGLENENPEGLDEMISELSEEEKDNLVPHFRVIEDQ